MNYLLAFLGGGIACLVAQFILDNTKLTPGHITSLYTVLGAILSFFSVYDNLVRKFGCGATLLISNFGHALYAGAYQGYLENGFLGIFSGMLTNSSGVITFTIICAFFVSVIFKPKN